MARYKSSAVYSISPETFDQIDDYIEACKAAGRNIQYGMDALTMLMAYTNLAIAREMSEGPNDPHMRYPGSAWKIPVRRISGAYFKGWKVTRLAPGVWELSNDSREAYFIEFGIHPTGSSRTSSGGTNFNMRVRRPVRKLSLRKTLQFVDQSQAGARVWEASFAPFRQGRSYTQRGGLLATDQVQSRSAYMQGFTQSMETI